MLSLCIKASNECSTVCSHCEQCLDGFGLLIGSGLGAKVQALSFLHNRCAANFSESLYLLGTWMNKGKEKGRS
jgi:hypothetical protein